MGPERPPKSPQILPNFNFHKVLTDISSKPWKNFQKPKVFQCFWYAANQLKGMKNDTKIYIKASNLEPRMPSQLNFAAFWAPSWLILAFLIAKMAILAAILLPKMHNIAPTWAKTSQLRANIVENALRDPPNLRRSLQTSIFHQISINISAKASKKKQKLSHLFLYVSILKYSKVARRALSNREDCLTVCTNFIRFLWFLWQLMI